jgi:YidC/Oxa1 family membrane protein insertase
MGLWTALLEVLRSALFGLSHLYGGSIGLAIVTLSLAVRLGLLPWTLRAARRSLALRAKLQKLQPELQRLKQKHAGNPLRLRNAVEAEYRRNGIRPLQDSGIGVGLVQMPIGIALYTVIKQGVAAGSRFLWIPNLARPDFLLGLATAVLTGVLMASTPAVAGTEPSRALMIAITLITFLMVTQLASGVALYWATNTAIGVLQNALVRRTTRE